MAGTSSMIHVRMDDELRKQATEVLDEIGLSTSQAVRLLFRRIAAERALPLELKVPNATTLAAMRESEELIRENRARFMTAEEMFEALDRGE